MIAHVDKAGAPTFKEIASLVRATQNLVRAIDGALVGIVDLESYLRQALVLYLNENPGGRSANIWGRSESRRLGTIVQIACNAGLSQFEPTSAPTNHISWEYLRELAKWSPKEALAELLPAGNVS